MSTSVTIDGQPCTLERLASGNIRVTHASGAYNAMHGAATEGEVSYEVHPVQRAQYAFLNELLPPAERARDADLASAARPWWSLGSGQGGKE